MALVILTMFIMAVYGYAKGNLYNIYGMIDIDGKICGGDKDVGYPDYKYMYFTYADFSIKDEHQRDKTILMHGVCVKECPTLED